MTKKRVGQIVRIKEDGRRGIIYNDDFPKGDGRYKIDLIDKDHKPLLSNKTGKQQVVFKKGIELEVIGFVN